MTPVAEHVRPSAKGLEISVRVIAEPPSGGYQATLMAARAAVDLEVAVADADRDCPDGFSALRRVFRQVRGYRCACQFSRVRELNSAGVDLMAPADIPAERTGRVRKAGESRSPGCGADRISELLRCDARRRYQKVWVAAVQAEDGMEVDEATSLKLGNFGVGEADAQTLIAETDSGTPLPPTSPARMSW